MTNQPMTQSQKRFEESIAKLFSPKQAGAETTLFLTSSTDIGVIRNGGRNGARFAPKSFLSTFKKFTLNSKLIKENFFVFEVANEEEENLNFKESQNLEAKRITKYRNQYPGSRIYHIGGGHDHVYPLLCSLGESYSKLIVINIDAHADTRTDPDAHSGTPFRQFDEKFLGQWEIYQIGLNPFANSISTLTDLTKAKTSVIWRKDVNSESLNKAFSEIEKSLDKSTAVVFSLDADALSASEVPGVSAVNPAGLNLNEILQIWNLYKNLKLNHPPIVGIYELNPIYDSLASLSMRTISSFVYETI